MSPVKCSMLILVGLLCVAAAIVWHGQQEPRYNLVPVGERMYLVDSHTGVIEYQRH